MEKLFNTLISQKEAISMALEQHLVLSLISLLIAIIVAVPLAISVMNRPKTAKRLLQLVSVIQTIPSLALLGLLIPLVGIGNLPAIIALVAYAILPIFENSYAGLTNIDPNLEEAADALGLSRMKKLRRLEIPLAMPVILSGIRIAAVFIIGTATLAALIGAGGLGSFILLGIENNNNDLLIIGAALSAVLALVFNYGIQLIQKLSLKKLLFIGLIFLGLIGGGAFYQNFQNSNKVIIAGKLGSEPDILINMYRDLILEENPKLKVELKPNFGTTNFLYQALQKGQVDIYPEFSGTILQTQAKKTKISKNPETTYRDAQNYMKTQQLTYLDHMKYQNGYALAVSQSLASKYNLKKISDLKKVPSEEIKAGFTRDFYNQAQGWNGLKQSYGLNNVNQIKTLESNLLYQAIGNQQLSLIDGYTTDADLYQYHLVSLQDDLHYFPPYQGAPLVRPTTLTNHPEIKTALNKLNNQITDAEMREMNYRVAVKHESAAKVAHEYLTQHHLIK
ncbi:ABC transporter permease/substrate-binding protein [Fructilactobacillus vespulae]|uniref:ABC transporter permease/substrate-binding protein n=1 Tax=Fructilactobacillus vespulae TaxID=1249630 RepID=UPI0039B3697A